MVFVCTVVGILKMCVYRIWQLKRQFNLPRVHLVPIPLNP